MASWSPLALALPIGFGDVPAGVEYDELEHSNFYIYHDRQTPTEARYTLGALESVRPTLERWFGRRRTSALPVIMSATTDHASFANFVTDAIELQTMGQGHRDLAWHEFVHHAMYRHFNNIFGPAGSVLHLMWMPSWYVEGLAEALSVSVGSDEQAAIERYHAMRGEWPSFERLHSLYKAGKFAYRGYALSGGFVGYLLRRNKDPLLPQFLEQYYSASMPWIWPYSILPFENSLPLDQVLVEQYQKNGRQLYEDYKVAAGAYWRSRKDLWYVPRAAGGILDIANVDSLQVRQGQAFVHRRNESRDVVTERLVFSDGRAVKSKILRTLPEDSVAWTISKGQIIVGRRVESIGGVHRYVIETKAGRPLTNMRSGFVSRLRAVGDQIVWREVDTEISRICRISLKGITQEPCQLEARTPEHLDLIGDSTEQGEQVLWLRRSRQRLDGDVHELLTWNLKQAAPEPVLRTVAAPKAVVRHGADRLIVLFGEKHHRSLRWLDSATRRCRGELALGDLVFDINPWTGGRILASIYAGEESHVVALELAKLPVGNCSPMVGHDSPLLAAVKSYPKTLSLAQALDRTNPWPVSNSDTLNLGSNLKSDTLISNSDTLISATPAPAGESESGCLNSNLSPDSGCLNVASGPAKTRIRPVVAVPWLGADSDGMQYAVLSVPLMDHMQNEELRLYFGYGLYSRFPHTELSLSSSRFWTTLKLDVFRYQTWNGRYATNLDSDEEPTYAYAYLDERGVRLSTAMFLHSLRTRLSLGLKSSYLQNYRGAPWTKEGQLNEPFARISNQSRLGPTQLSTSLGTFLAPSDLNSSFDYNKVEVTADLSQSFDWRSAYWNLGLESSRTRGRSKRELQEVYRPMQVYVPSGGSSLNSLNLPVYGDGSLFQADYGNTKGRIGLSSGFDLIERVDLLVRLLYWESLTASAFLNYGGVWQDRQFDAKDLIPAHGYSLMATFDAKGINIFAGGGVGQVFGNNFEAYASFSFDAIF